ncbi:MAG: hypothetical protein ACK4NB_04060, partial [Fimbriimonadales bacterium]
HNTQSGLDILVQALTHGQECPCHIARLEQHRSSTPRRRGCRRYASRRQKAQRTCQHDAKNGVAPSLSARTRVSVLRTNK